MLERAELTRESMLEDRSQREALAEMYVCAQDMIPVGISFEHRLHPPQSYLILPLFALFSAGVAFSEKTVEAFPGPVSLGIILGLVFGKQLGLTLFSWLTIRSGYAERGDLAAIVGSERIGRYRIHHVHLHRRARVYRSPADGRGEDRRIHRLTGFRYPGLHAPT